MTAIRSKIGGEIRGTELWMRDMDAIGPAIGVQAIELEIAKSVRVLRGQRLAALLQNDLRIGDTLDLAVDHRRDRPAEKARRVTLSVLVVDTRLRPQLLARTLQVFPDGNGTHFLVLDLDRFERIGRA